jgi:histidyl-tRNA synthetase
MLWLNSLGLNKLRLEINSVGCPDCAALYDKALQEYYRPFLGKLCPDCQNRFNTNPRRLLDCKVPSCIELRDDAPSQLNYLDEPCEKHFEAVCNYLQAMKIKYIINPRIVRGLDYYTNTAFEIVYEGLGAQNSLAGGEDITDLLNKSEVKVFPQLVLLGVLNACL